MAWLYVPGAADWNLDSPLPSETVTAASVTWREKRMLPQRWSSEWKKGGWIRLLSGMTLTPSQAMSSVRSWAESTFSQEASPASLTASLDRAAGPTTNATSGHRQQGSSERYVQGQFFSKTSQESPDTTGSEFGLSYTAWVTRLRKAYSQRPRSAPTTDENGSLFWPTPDTQNHRDGSNMREAAKGRHAVSLHHAVMWPTPAVQQFESNVGGSEGRVGKTRYSLHGMAKTGLWPTPAAHPAGWKDIEVVDKDGNPPTHWNQRLYHKETGRLVEKGLEQAVTMMWPTPSSAVTDPKSSVKKLTGAVQVFPTPLARDHKDSGPNGQLNPTWVEWLMGWPIGWTDLDSQVTESSRYRQLMRSCLWQLIGNPDA